MSYGNEVVRISRLANGWELEICDPSTDTKEDKKPAKAASTDCCAPICGDYKDPWRSLAFTTFEELLEFLEEKGPTLKPRNFDDEYAKSFAATVKSMGATDDAKKEAKK